MKLIESLRYSAQMHIEQNVSSMPVPPDLFLALCDAAEALREGRDTKQLREYPNRYPQDYASRVDAALAKLNALEQKP